MGDMPIYVGYHSADVWANKKHFLLASKVLNMEGNNLIAYISRVIQTFLKANSFFFNLYAEQERLSPLSQRRSS